MIEVLSKKMLGERYSRAIKSVIIAFTVYIGLDSLEYKLNISTNVFLFSTFFFVVGVMIQALSSDDNAKYLKGFFSMPFEKNKVNTEYCTIMGMYILTARASLLFAVYFAFASPDVISVLMLILNFIFACLASMIIFAFLKTKFWISAITFIAGVAVAFLVNTNIYGIIIYAILTIAVIFPVMHIDPYRFMKNKTSKIKISSKTKSNHFLIQKYLLRYIFSNKSFTINSLVLIVFGCFFVKMFENATETNALDFLPIGLAMISINTPFAIVISSNKKLREKLEVMPNKMSSFCIPYTMTITVFYLVCYAVYILALYFLGVKADLTAIISAVVFAIESAVIVCFLENKFPITKWSVETDLWHNPRKYIIPIVLMIQGFLIQFI